MFPPHCVEGSGEDEIVHELRELAAGATVVRKHRFSGFYGTELERLLAGCPAWSRWPGVCTDICVLHTVADLRIRDYQVVVHRDSWRPTRRRATTPTSSTASPSPTCATCWARRSSSGRGARRQGEQSLGYRGARVRAAGALFHQSTKFWADLPTGRRGVDRRRLLPLVPRQVGLLLREVDDRQIVVGELAARVGREDGAQQAEGLGVAAAGVEREGELRPSPSRCRGPGQHLGVQPPALSGCSVMK